MLQWYGDVASLSERTTKRLCTDLQNTFRMLTFCLALLIHQQQAIPKDASWFIPFHSTYGTLYATFANAFYLSYQLLLEIGNHTKPKFPNLHKRRGELSLTADCIFPLSDHIVISLTNASAVLDDLHSGLLGFEITDSLDAPTYWLLNIHSSTFWIAKDCQVCLNKHHGVLPKWTSCPVSGEGSQRVHADHR